jgi:hypothetical protein
MCIELLGIRFKDLPAARPYMVGICSSFLKIPTILLCMNMPSISMQVKTLLEAVFSKMVRNLHGKLLSAIIVELDIVELKVSSFGII